MDSPSRVGRWPPVRLSLELIGVSLALGGGLIQIRCVVFNCRLTITMQRQPVRSKSFRDFAQPQNNERSSDADAPLPPTADLPTVLVLPREWTSH